MKRLGTSNLYSYSSSSYPSHWGNFALVLGENSKKSKKSAKTRCEIVQKENGRCEICDDIARKKLQKSSEQHKVKEEKRREVVEKNVVVIIDDGEEQKKDHLEEKMEGSVVEEKMVLVVNGEADIEKREVLEERVKKNNKVEEGKIVIMDNEADVEALLEEVEKNAYGEGDERNGDGVVVVVDVVKENNEDLFSVDIIGEGNLLSGWDEWKYEVEKNTDCSYPLWWETENNDFKFQGVEPPTNDWVESLWQV